MSRFGGLRNFLLIWSGQLVSGVGTRLTSFSLGLWVYQETGSTSQFAFVFVAMAVPAIVLAPVAGALVDRWDRRRTMIVCELAATVTVAALALLFASGQLAMWHIYLGVGVTALSSTFLQPAYAASIPLLASQEQLTRANGLVQLGSGVALVAGPALAGLLMAALPLAGVLMIDAATFMVGAAALYLARVPRPAHATSDDETSLWSDAAAGFSYVRAQPGLLGLLTLFGVTNFLFGIASIAITPLVMSMTNNSEAMTGLQMSIGCSGLLVGGMIVSIWGGPRSRVHCILVASMLAGVFLALHGLVPSFVLVAAAGFFLFMTMPFGNSANAALWQSKVPAHLQGRCFAMQRVLAEGAMPLGYCLAGPLAEYVFEPLLMPGGALADSIGQLMGTGAGRGLGLMFMVLGALMLLATAAAYCVPAIRRLEGDVSSTAPLAKQATSDASA